MTTAQTCPEICPERAFGTPAGPVRNPVRNLSAGPLFTLRGVRRSVRDMSDPATPAGPDGQVGSLDPPSAVRGATLLAPLIGGSA